jgi:hypothetical protein
MEGNEEVEAIREQRTAYGWSRPSPGELASDHARRTDRSRSVRWWSKVKTVTLGCPSPETARQERRISSRARADFASRLTTRTGGGPPARAGRPSSAMETAASPRSSRTAPISTSSESPMRSAPASVSTAASAGSATRKRRASAGITAANQPYPTSGCVPTARGRSGAPGPWLTGSLPGGAGWLSTRR